MEYVKRKLNLGSDNDCTCLREIIAYHAYVRSETTLKAALGPRESTRLSALPKRENQYKQSYFTSAHR